MDAHFQSESVSRHILLNIIERVFRAILAHFLTRNRRLKNMKLAKSNVTSLPAKPRKRNVARRSSPKLKPWEKRTSKYLISAIGSVVLVILGVSLEHLAHGIGEVTKAAVWSSWSLAIAIDVGMVASEITLIILAKMPDIGVESYARKYVIATIAVSMALNTLAFWPATSDPIAIALAVVLGCGIPAGVYHLTKVAGKLWLATNIR